MLRWDTGLVQKDIQERFRCTAENGRIFCVGAAGNAGFRKRSGDAFCRLGRDDVIYCLNAIRQCSGERDGAVLGKDAGGRGIRGIYGAIGFSGGNQRIADAAARDNGAAAVFRSCTLSAGRLCCFVVV